MSTASAWWQQAIGYEVYLPSFADGNGDGWGDLPGLIDHLDHLSWLGVDLLWVSPFFVSPMADHGYDIADYLNVDPSFGTLADVDRLIANARSRGIRVIADLVVNHTSSQHPWFTASRTDRDNPYRDYYLWRPGRGDEPPNNWVATFGGRAWTHDSASDEWYLHLFTPDQPDLNWSNPKVADEVDAIMRFWLDRGLAGFRVDTAHYLAKHPELPDNPLLPTDEVPTMGGAVADWYRYDHRHDIGQPQLRDIHRRWRTLADDYSAFLVGETYVLDPHRLAEHLNDQSGLHSIFYFGLVQQDPGLAAELIRTAATASAQLSWPQSSHDWTRPVTRYGGGPAAQRRSLALTALTLGLPGTPFLYQGEELGLSDGVVPPEAARDPMVRIGGAVHASRDPVRTPMPWRPGPGLGFTTAAAGWLPDGERLPTDTVSEQRTDPNSPLHAYRRMLHLARDLRRTVRGEPEWLDTGTEVVAYRRDNMLVAANLGATEAQLPASEMTPRVSTVRPSVQRHAATLLSGEAIICVP
ncbi:alpha-amylase family glycosyl hydrolase [Nocardia anaemiae]|uniref:alpha-amylase family glycosyl hydrolase n=1 Tax=Nocardia anaemiae TaxID=263910 RepID=UPI0007A4D0CE|nr:alpha-amylase family glycosyl hydrolase [Nocardia anaemiae]